LGGLNTKVDKGWCGTQFTRPSTDPTYTCNTFSGWYTTSGYTSLFNWSNTIDVNPTYVYAKWNPNEYTITYNCDE